MKATSRLRPSASSPSLVEAPSARTSPTATVWPISTTGFWWMNVPWFERRNLSRSYLSISPLSVSTRMRVAVTLLTRPGRSTTTTSPVSTAARYSMPVPMSGASAMRSGTAWRCMFEPIRARLASLCSRKGMSAVATETICCGETSM